MKRQLLCPLAIAALTIGFSSSAHAAALGKASEYNAFTFGNMTVISDAEGRIATGGNFSAAHYSIGKYASRSDYSLISGGSVTFGPGTVFNGGIFAEGPVSLSNYSIQGDVVSNSTVTAINGTMGQKRPNAGLRNPIDFASEESYLKAMSANLANKTANGTTTVSNWRAIKLTGGNTTNFFSLNGNDLDNAASFNFYLGTNEIAVINVSGTAIDVGPFGFYGTDVRPENILFNFYEATSLAVHNISFQGSILAPYADANFYSAHIDGTFIANSLSGSGQYNHHPFAHDLPGTEPVPEPATLLLFGTGLIGLCGALKKHVH